uniref:Transposase family Tnp2 protein n=1 Tax=Mycena chlorophos TaxID=658473 RepID=A0ABQ0L951_MYCCL|nr:predicted protein [Mycena chlorophos]
MVRVSSATAKNPERKKRCRCWAGCGLVLCKRTRAAHARKAPDRTKVLPSETVSEPDADLLMFDVEDIDELLVPPSPSPPPPPAPVPIPSRIHALTRRVDPQPDQHPNPPPLTNDLDLEIAPGETPGWDSYDEERDVDDELRLAVSCGDRTLPRTAEAWSERNAALDEQTRDNLRAILLKVYGNVPRAKFNMMRGAFVHKMIIDSEYVILRQLSLLVGSCAVWYDCCINTCMAYTGPDTEADDCRYCHEARFKRNGKPRRTWCYFRLIPRLQALFQDPEIVKLLRYRYTYQSFPGFLNDFFGGRVYERMRNTPVVVDGQQLPYCYFSGKNDIALSFASDSFLIYESRRKGPSATPMIAKLLNLPPQIRTRLGNILPLFVAPGPHPIKDARSFSIPLDDELAQLAYGVETYDALDRETFLLRAYASLTEADLLAMAKLRGNKGPNSKSACGECLIVGVRDDREEASEYTNYYLPTVWPNGDYWNPHNLPMRTQTTYETQLMEIEAAMTKTERERLKKLYGINYRPYLQRVPSLDPSEQYSADCMHLFFENVVPNQWNMWAGKYKQLSVGTGDYELKPAVLQEIFNETAAAMKTIPSSFVRTLARGFDKFTAESWSFWFLYLMPGLLHRRLPDVYHRHALQLVEFIKLCTQLSINRADLDQMDEMIVEYVLEFERLYYQYDIERLRTCPLVIHLLLHVPRSIRNTGPVWVGWTFWVERFCQFMKRGIMSRRFPWANMSKRVHNHITLREMRLRYDVADEFAPFEKPSLGLTRFEHVYRCHPETILRSPLQDSYAPGDETLLKIASYYSNLLGKQRAPAKQLLQLLPRIMPRWGKVRIPEGDSIRAAWATPEDDEDFRDNTAVRFSAEVLEKAGDGQRVWVDRLFYGRLEEILVCQMPSEEVFGRFAGQIRLIAAITPFATNGQDATKGIVTYTRELTRMVVEADYVTALVGRFETRKKWVIVDRTRGLVNPEFVPREEDDVDRL